jgi:hypothetical protein
MDASVSRIADIYADSIVATKTRNDRDEDTEDELDVDELFDELENEDDGRLREQRLAQLQRE